MRVCALALTSVLLAGAAPEIPWKVAKRSDTLTVYWRERSNGVHELKAEGVIAAPADQVWAAIRDYDNYSTFMPYTEVSKVLATEEDGKVTYFYSVVNAPLVDKRDYVIRLVDESTNVDGKRIYKTTWSTSTNHAPAKRKDAVRLTVNEGYWTLEARPDGKTTQATYYLYTDPAGAIPKFVKNKANTSAMPDVFEAVRKKAAAAK